MKALLVVVVWMLTGAAALGQSRTVLPEELQISVEVEAREHTPFVREMVLITIRGQYTRHITRESLIQPDFEGFSWAQLGPDSWADERIDGRLVKTFARRMAIYPDRAGPLTIGAFTHKLTLTDEGDDWFDHQITSAPVTIEVAPAPVTEGWWFPTRTLRVSDQWSNAPALLKPGEGVLRVVRLEALGVTPEMIPPMPTLTSPSAIIFPHPEKRLVELSPEGPITYAFWRWTIRPTNDVSTIVEPLTFDYFDTAARTHRTVEISAQRVAYGDVVPAEAAPGPDRPKQARLPGWAALIAAALVFAGGVTLGLRGRGAPGFAALHRFPLLDPMAWGLTAASRRGDAAEVRRRAARMLDRDGPAPYRADLLRLLDQTLFSPTRIAPDLRAFSRAFLRRHG